MGETKEFGAQANKMDGETGDCVDKVANVTND